MRLKDALDEQSAAIAHWMDRSDGVFALRLDPTGVVQSASHAFLVRSGRVGVTLELSDLLADPSGAPLAIASSRPGAAHMPRRLQARGDDSSWWVVAFDLADGGRLLLGRIATDSEDAWSGQATVGGIQLVTAQSELHRANEQLRLANAQIDRLMRADSLTGLANRREFDERLELEWTRARRHGRPITLVIADIDHFKVINDTYGHGAGDAALRAVADVLAQGIRASDLAARIGGEEFALLLPECSAEQGVVLAERIRATIEGTVIAAISGALTVSLGLAELLQAEDATSLMARADVALYAAKRRGRNRVHVAPQVD